MIYKHVNITSDVKKQSIIKKKMGWELQSMRITWKKVGEEYEFLDIHLEYMIVCFDSNIDPRVLFM